MIESKTVFILGAGASCPYGFPSGKKLIQEILQTIEFSKIDNPTIENYYGKEIVQTINAAGFSTQMVDSFYNDLLTAQPKSIDLFLENQSDYQDIGKAFITMNILHHEGNSTLFKKDDWFQTIWDEMAGHSYKETLRNNVAFITYNYDRSLECMLVSGIQSMHKAAIQTSTEILQRIPVIHLHGQCGNLYDTEAHNYSYYGIILTNSPERLKAISKSIKIVHEVDPGTNEFVNARTLIESADHVFFLGFGYHDENVERLKLPTNKKYLGSWYGFTPTECVRIKKRVPNLGFHTTMYDCKQFVRNVTY